MTRNYDLKLATGEIVTWDGSDGVTAAQSYANAHPGAVVVGWREAHRRGMFPMLAPIVEATR